MNTKPGVLAVMDETSTKLYADGKHVTAGKLDEARATVERLAEVADAAASKLEEMAREFSRPNFTDRYGDGPDMAFRARIVRKALADFNGEQS